MGYDDRSIAALVKSQQWVKVRHGSYVPARLWSKLGVEDRHRVAARAVLKTAKSPAVLSHVSSAIEWGADVWDLDLSEVHITRLDGKCGRREAGVSQHRGRVEPHSIAVHDGVRLLDAARTAVDVTTMCDVEHSLVIVNSLLHLGATTLDDAWAASRVMDGWPDTLTTRIVLGLADRRIESVGESRTCHFLWAQGLPRFEPQYKIRDANGRVIARVDFALPELGVFLEFDGRIKYERFPEGKTLAQVLREEREREKRICRQTGWICIRIGWKDLEDPERLAHEIRTVLASRRRAPGNPA
jgi:very-short-patch-repair endonuclease